MFEPSFFPYLLFRAPVSSCRQQNEPSVVTFPVSMSLWRVCFLPNTFEDTNYTIDKSQAQYGVFTALILRGCHENQQNWKMGSIEQNPAKDRNEHVCLFFFFFNLSAKDQEIKSIFELQPPAFLVRVISIHETTLRFLRCLWWGHYRACLIRFQRSPQYAEKYLS